MQSTVMLASSSTFSCTVACCMAIAKCAGVAVCRHYLHVGLVNDAGQVPNAGAIVHLVQDYNLQPRNRLTELDLFQGVEGRCLCQLDKLLPTLY